MQRGAQCDDDDNDVEDEEEEDAWSKKLRYAEYFDDFFNWVYAVQQFEKDDAAYHKEHTPWSGSTLIISHSNLHRFSNGTQPGRPTRHSQSRLPARPEQCGHAADHTTRRRPQLPILRAAEGATKVNLKFDLHNHCARNKGLNQARKHRKLDKQSVVVRE
eukprot:6209751-Pleurochrysis_carterae.AAC.1